MHHVSVDPPPFFHRGPSPLARLAFFGLLSIALLFADTRYRYLEGVRQAVAVALYPVQRALELPGAAFSYVADYFGSKRTLADDNARLKQDLVAKAPAVQDFALLRTENQRLKGLLELKARYSGAATAVEVLYSGRDPFTQKLYVDKGSSDGVQPGSAVIDETDGGHQGRRPSPHVGYRRHLPARPRRCGGRRAGSRHRTDVRAHRMPSAGRGRSRGIPAGARPERNTGSGAPRPARRRRHGEEGRAREGAALVSSYAPVSRANLRSAFPHGGSQ